MIRLRGPLAALTAAFLTLGLVGGCGVSDPEDLPPGFEFTAVGPGGGTVAAGDVKVIFAPGALVGDTAVTILPQADPFGIAPGLGDPCAYTYLGPLWCVGPVGLELQVESELQIKYDPSLIPDGLTADNLVLLQWNDSLQALQPNLSAEHNQNAALFTDFTLNELGHVAVGVRVCPPGGIVFSPQPPGQPGDEEGQEEAITLLPEGLFVFDVDVGIADTLMQIDTGGGVPQRFLPAPDGGTRILYLQDGAIRTVQPHELAVPVEIAGAGFQLELADPFLGWLREGNGQDAYFRHFLPTVQPVSGESPDQDQRQISRIRNDGSLPAAAVESFNALDITLEDARQSLDGLHALLVINEFADKLVEPGLSAFTGNVIAIVDVDTPALVSYGDIPTGGGLFPPRFTPDSARVSVIDADAKGVTRYRFDGTGATTRWAPALGATQTILACLFTHDLGHCAAIVRDSDTGEDSLILGTLGNPGQVDDVFPLGEGLTYEAFELNPVVNVVYLDLGTGVLAFPLDTSAEVIGAPSILHAEGIEFIDFNRMDGRLLQVIEGAHDQKEEVANIGVPVEGPTLQQVLDDRLRDDSIDVLSDQSGDAIFALRGPGTHTLAFRSAKPEGENINGFGLYEYGNPDNKVLIFETTDPVGTERTIAFKPNGDVVRIEPDLTETVIGTGFDDHRFGLYLAAQNAFPFLFSESVLNFGRTQMIAFRGQGDDPLDLSGDDLDHTVPFGENDYLVCFDDLLTPFVVPDYTDFIVLIKSIGVTNLIVTDPVGREPHPVVLPEGIFAEHARWFQTNRTTPGMSSPPRVR